jgi:hypothetical protein
MSRVDDVAAELIAEQEQNSQMRLEDNVRMSLNTDAEKRLKAEHLAQVIGEPDVDFVERNYATVERSARTRGLYNALPADSVTRNILSDPRERASLPDAESLAKIEGSITTFGNVSPSYRKGQDVHAGGKQAFQMMVSGSDDATYDTTMKAYNDRMDRVQYGDLNWAQRVPGYTAEMVGLYSGMLPDAGMAAAYAGAGAGMAAGPEAVPAGAFAGFKIGTTKEMFEVEAGWAFDEFRALKFDATGLPVDRNAAVGAAILVGGINAGLEFIGFNQAVLHAYGLPQLIKSLGKGGVKNLLNNPAARDAFSKIGQDYAAGVMTEGTTEALQELAVIGFGDLLKGSYSGIEAYGARMWESFQAGAGGAAGIAAPGAAIRTTNVTLDNRKQKQQQDAIAALGEDIKTSKLYSNAPKKFQEFIRNIQTRHGTVDTVYMDAEAAQTYFQNIEPQTLEKDMPETAIALREAMDTGGYVAIPLDEFVTYVAPNMADVSQDITFDPLTPTQRQYQEIESKAKELQDWYEKTQGQIDSAEDPVYGQVYTELLGAGRKADVAEKEAMLFTTMIRRMAERVGMDPEEYYRSKKISIRGELIQQEGIDVPTATGGLINLLREGRGPQQKDVFGPSLIEFLMGTGILDEGGELSARDLEKQIPAYGRRRLARESGIPMSEAFERARDAGYLDIGENTSEENALLAAIDRELGGDRVYSPNQISVGAQELDTALEQLRELIDREGLDLDAMTNEEIMDRLGITELEQPGDKTKPRGYLEVSPQRLAVTLTKAANLSTFIHESGHLFLELMKDAATLADVDPQLLADWETVKAYLGSDGNLTREQHETYARSFEAYLFEGKAPTKELAGLFSRFKSWLIGVYKTLNKLDVQLTDDIRAVFDRMLVAEASIERAADDIVPAFKGGTDLSDAEINALMELQRQALRAGQDEMEAQAQSEIRAMRTEAYRNRRDALTQEITAKIDAQPVYAVQRLLRTGNDERMTVPEHLLGKKLSSGAVIDLFLDSKVLRRIPGLTRKEGGVHPDVFADLYGFESGYQMVQQIIAAPPSSEVIRNQVQAQLDEEFGNMAQDTETIERAALALHNNAMANFLVAEARAMNRKLGRKDNVTLNQATKEAARRHIARLKLRQIRPHSYYQAELKAARASQEAVAAGKFEEAAQLKQQQLLNHHLYREARMAVDRADLIRRKLKKYDSATVMQAIRKGDPMAANGIEALLAGVELKKTALTKIDARNRLAQYVQAMEAQGETVLIDPALYDGADLVNYKEMTLEQLEALDSSVAALAKQGRDANKVRVEGELVEMAQVIEDLDAVASANLTAKQINQYDVDHRSPLTKAFSSFLASLRKIEFECRFADGDIVGKWHRTIFQPFVDAQNAKEEMLSTSVAELQSIMGTLTRKDAQRLNQSINFLGTTLNRGDLYVVALNMGNQGNWDRLFSRRWKGQEREVLAKLQDELTLEDFRRIEALGQMIDRMYEPMAAVSERVDGVRPPKVEAKPLYLAKYGVELSGWYYPVKYQDAIGTREASVLEESNSIDMGPSPITGQVSKSMTKSRMTGAGGVISLDFAGLPQHLHQVVHYITHYESVRNFDKLRRKSEFRAMYESYFDANGYKQLRSWLQNIATNGTIAQTSHDASKTMDTIFRRARFGGSLLGLGWKVSSAAMQVLGAGPAAKEVGALNMASWLLKLSYGRVGTMGQAKVHPDYQRALDASPELRHLDSQIDRDIREFTDNAVEIMRRNPGTEALHWVKDQAFYLIIAVQKHINAATWLAAHEKAQGEGRTVAESVQYADATVRQTQSGGGLKDLAGLQQGNELAKLVTLFYTYFSVQHNQLRMTGRQDLIKGFIKGEGPNGRAKSLGKFAAANLYIVLVPALVEALLKYDEDDDDDLVPYLATRIASSYVAGVPIFRDVYSAATRDWQAPSTPLDQVVQSLVGASGGAYDWLTGEGNWTDIRNIAKAMTLVTWLPAYQVVMYTEALATADDFGEAVSHVLFGTPYSQRQELED